MKVVPAVPAPIDPPVIGTVANDAVPNAKGAMTATATGNATRAKSPISLFLSQSRLVKKTQPLPKCLDQFVRPDGFVEVIEGGAGLGADTTIGFEFRRRAQVVERVL